MPKDDDIPLHHSHRTSTLTGRPSVDVGPQTSLLPTQPPAAVTPAYGAHGYEGYPPSNRGYTGSDGVVAKENGTASRYGVQGAENGFGGPHGSYGTGVAGSGARQGDSELTETVQR